jgi:protocatechuate 3,4-dioxygenase beta subunit
MATTAATQRRTFLRQLLIAVPLMPSFEGLGEGSGQDRLSSGWQTELVGADEPGERLVVSGQVLRQEGSAAPGVRLSVYHTDADGYYTRPVSDPRRARIHGSVLTDRDGRYAFHTIKPGHYPGYEQPAHIHVHVEADGLPEHWIDSFLFEGDPYLRADEGKRSRQAGRFGHVMAVAKDGRGAVQCRRDIRLDAGVAERNHLVNGWYR